MATQIIGFTFLLTVIVIIYAVTPGWCQDISPEVAASLQSLLNEETVLRTKTQNELQQLDSELSTLQALRQNGKIIYFQIE